MHPPRNARLKSHTPLSSRLTRRDFMAAAAVAAGYSAAHAAPTQPYRVAVIGHTGRGDYGHGLDRVWLDVPNVQLVAVADANPEGLAGATRRLGGIPGFGDYRQMLRQVRPDLLSIGPRWIDQHRDMVVAAAEEGVRGVYLEKPMCRTMAEADEMVEACDAHGTKLAVAHQTRYSPILPVIDGLLQSGRLGQVIEFRARGKEDHRGGGEDLWVLGTHVLDLMRRFGGDAEWCFATIAQEGRSAARGDIGEGAEGIGRLVGDQVHAMYRLSGGATGYFDSVRGAGGSPSRFGLRIYGTRGIVELGTGFLPPARLLEDSPDQSGRSWQPITSAGVGEPEPLEDGGLHAGNVLAVRDLIEAIEQDRQPVSSIHEARRTTEMIVAVFASHFRGAPVPLPLAERQCPLRPDAE